VRSTRCSSTDVRVPVENLVGEENKGWDYAKFLLGNERTNIARIGMSKQRIARIRELAAQEMSSGRPLIEDERFREKLASIEIDLKALELTQLRVVTADAKRGNTGRPDPASSILKIKGSEIQQATTHLLMEVMGPYALPYLDEHDPGHNEPFDGPDYAAPAARTTSTTARSRSTAARTRFRKTSSPRPCWDCEGIKWTST
jgi:alkylation response protein AidB-like acyl-CoA dehydrogenase